MEMEGEEGVEVVDEKVYKWCRMESGQGCIC
jgi:hypothetical protein